MKVGTYCWNGIRKVLLMTMYQELSQMLSFCSRNLEFSQKGPNFFNEEKVLWKQSKSGKQTLMHFRFCSAGILSVNTPKMEFVCVLIGTRPHDHAAHDLFRNSVRKFNLQPWGLSYNLYSSPHEMQPFYLPCVTSDVKNQTAHLDFER